MFSAVMRNGKAWIWNSRLAAAEGVAGEGEDLPICASVIE